jgi:hypothetical protein
MSQRFCICLSISGTKTCHCFTLPTLINPWPLGDPGGPVENPVEVEGVDHEVIHDLLGLASIRGIAQGLRPEQAREVSAAVDAVVMKINTHLPSNIEATVVA